MIAMINDHYDCYDYYCNGHCDYREHYIILIIMIIVIIHSTFSEEPFATNF